MMRAEQLQQTAYNQAIGKAQSMKKSYEITKIAMERARLDATASNQVEELNARNRYAERQSSIWYEAYQNHRSSARVEAQYKEE